MKTTYTISKFTLLTISMVLFSYVSFAQTSLPKAEALMHKFEFVEATEMYLEHFEENSPNKQDLRNISYCFIQQNDTKSAERWLSKLVQKNDANSEDILIYANLLKAEGKYSEAKIYYEKYASLEPSKKGIAEKWIETCEESLSWTYEPEFFTVTNVANLNSEKSDFGLVPFKNGYIVTSDRTLDQASSNNVYGWTGNPFLKMYQVDINENTQDVKSFKLIEPLTHEYHNGPAIYNNEDNTVYFTRTKTVKQIKKPTNPDPTSWFIEPSNDIYTNRLEIYSSTNSNGEWSEPLAFENNNPDAYSVGHPTLSPNKKIMYFVSDMPGGFGATDIWYCEKRNNGTWGDPRNAGDEINTDKKELFPFVDQDGTLFFSSEGHSGMGGLDIFKSDGKKKSWSNPENLKYPINSPKDDFSIYFTETETMGYFSSNRYGGQGSDDIYSFVFSPPSELILSVSTKELLEDGSIVSLDDVDIEITKIENEFDDKLFASLTTDDFGQGNTSVDCNEKYTIRGTKEDYFSQSTNIETICVTKNDTVYVELIFEKIILDKPIVIENIYYDFDKWNIRLDASDELDKIVIILQENPNIIIELGSHTDARGTFYYNENLSQNRAESAIQYIIDNGISKERISAKGYGEYVPVNKCVDGVYCSEDDHQLNRRTEFKVTGYSSTQPVIYSAIDE